MSSSNDKKTKRSYSKRMRLPNGFGQITKLKGNLRNPFRAMVTVGKTPMGKPICKLLKPKSYFKTYNEAYQALMEYHKDPIDLLSERMTCNDLYERWSEEHFKNISESSKQQYVSTWKYCSFKYNTPVISIRTKDIRECIMKGQVRMKNGDVKQASPNTQANIKTLWSLMLDFALEHDIVSRNYAREMSMPKEVTEGLKTTYQGHTCLSDEDIEMLRTNITNIYAEMALVQCYMGWRPGELCELKTSNIDLENWIIVGGFKTKAGTDRIVPIHPDIRSIIENRYNPEHDKLYNVSYRTYLNNFIKVLPEHQLHDMRKTFVTKAKHSNMNEYAIKRIVGHSVRDITEAVYTERNIAWLQEEMSKLVV